MLYSVDISKSLESKRKRLETFTQSSVKASSKRVEETWRKQQQERPVLTIPLCITTHKPILTDWLHELLGPLNWGGGVKS